MKPIKRLLWWLLAGSAGGINRGRILEEILDRPRNANELAEILNLDYKTVRHHLDVLEKNRLVAPPRIRGSDGYGRMYFPSEILEKNMEYFNEIWGKIGKNKIKKKGDND